MANSIYWYDYETFGINPRLDRLAQFGGIRTDEDLNIISDPLVIYCKPADDMLPDPYACLVTGITPQKALADGLIESEFIATIHKEFSQPGTCIAGYNSIRFDDEFTRNSLYRNFFNPYTHEWQYGNSRWDLIDIVRLTRALRPDGINWPVGDDGRPSIRLELLTRENGISHESAHDAMSDVYATIEMAKLIREKQPRLFDYMYGLRKKGEVSKLLNLRTHEAVLHVSSMYSSERHAIAMVMPICQHPTNKNSIIVYDLSSDPTDFIEIDANEISGRMYTKASELPEGIKRIPLKDVHINKCPVIVPLKTMDAASAERLEIDIEACEANRQIILDNIDILAAKTLQVFSQNDFPDVSDPDAQIYSGGFFSNTDYDRMDRIRKSSPEELSKLNLTFDDPRLPEMLFRYRARNFPESLSDEEKQRWNDYRKERFTDPALSPRTMNRFLADIEELQGGDETTGAQLVILEELLAYADIIKP
ncbi:MAG: exodeoxyribonuclease I [Gammaproteobacteria bacterium]|nr:exodeoxyribonuclease I [Gammaproteobacteria bacterium]